MTILGSFAFQRRVCSFQCTSMYGVRAGLCFGPFLAVCLSFVPTHTPRLVTDASFLSVVFAEYNSGVLHPYFGM